ncbi:2-dehydropantoate 2-reductase [Microbacterium aoyamense]|uniref:2-dehydropantoate 2-reductase n=1 Tax=Microbacterium aoyamense TaxID=344166 RepID=A0ABN2Q0V0_9MICO|nr:2-dehydropantoate 2-reductase [Microbacterium aoyamense]
MKGQHLRELRLLIVGVGAVGGYIGSTLIDAGLDVTFLVHPARQKVLESEGLRLSRGGDIHAAEVSTVTAATLGPEYDAVFLAVKAFALEGAIADLTQVGRSPAIIPSLNGIRHIDALSAAFPGQVLGGVTLVSTELEADGAIRVIQPGGTLTFGELDGSTTDRTERIQAATSRSTIPFKNSATIVADMWEKWLFLASGGALNTLLDADVGQAAAVEGGTRTANAVVDEIADIMTAAGHTPRPEALESARSTLTQPASPFTTSMYRDHVAGRHVEVEAILGDLVRLADAHRRQAPLVSAAAAALRVER